jgi:hypothetical protein
VQSNQEVSVGSTQSESEKAHNEGVGTLKTRRLMGMIAAAAAAALTVGGAPASATACSPTVTPYVQLQGGATPVALFDLDGCDTPQDDGYTIILQRQTPAGRWKDVVWIVGFANWTDHYTGSTASHPYPPACETGVNYRSKAEVNVPGNPGTLVTKKSPGSVLC